MRIAIIGHGFVGKAIDYGFEHHDLEKIIVDPNYGTSVEDLTYVDAAFICVPTPMSEDGSINSGIVQSCVSYLKNNNLAKMIIVKSTITPDVIQNLQSGENGDKVIYNPEFLTERNYAEDFINPDFHIMGGDKKVAQQVVKLYTEYSKCKTCPVHYMSGMEASFVKYGINSYLASKVLWFNQFYDIIDVYDCNYNTILKAITSDSRITDSHTQVPGFDGRRGYGGACFPKDTKAFSQFDVMNKLTVLEEVIRANNEYRKKYTKDDREKEQNVHFD